MRSRQSPHGNRPADSLRSASRRFRSPESLVAGIEVATEVEALAKLNDLSSRRITQDLRARAQRAGRERDRACVEYPDARL